MSTVYLHIGTAKTGTTALQRFFVSNRSRLNKKDFDHPIMPFHFPRMADGRNAHFLTLWQEADSDERWNKGFEVIKEACGLYGNVTMSDEVLWAQCANDGFLEAVRKGFDSVGAEVKIIVYLRRQDEMVESHWNQMVKGKLKLTEDFDSFVGSGGYDRLFPLDYKAVLDRISACFGRENIIVRPYEREQFKDGSIYADFLDILGLEPDDEYEISEYAVNTRLPWEVVEIKRVINSIDSYRDPDMPNFFREVIKDAYGLELSKELPDIRTGRFSGEQRQKFIARYEEGNALVAREYLNKADGILFINKPKDLPRWEPKPAEIHKDIIRVLAGAAVYEYKKRRELEAKVNKLSEKVSRLLAQEKDIKDLKDQIKNLTASFPFKLSRRLKGSKEEQ